LKLAIGHHEVPSRSRCARRLTRTHPRQLGQ